MEPRNINEVIVVDIKMRFWSMVSFMIKWVIASVPALVVLAVFWMLVAIVFRGLMGGAMMWRGEFFRPMDFMMY